MKPRSDNKLAALPGPQKQQLRTWLIDENKSYEEARELLRQLFDVRTSTGALSKFYRTDCFTLRTSEAKSFAEEAVKAGRAAVANLDEATELIIRQRAFEQAYARNGDLDALAVLSKILGDRKKLELKAADQALTERRVRLLEKKAAQADRAEAITGNKELTDAEKAAQMRALFGMG
jgi:hypothetical protein